MTWGNKVKPLEASLKIGATANKKSKNNGKAGDLEVISVGF